MSINHCGAGQAALCRQGIRRSSRWRFTTPAACSSTAKALCAICNPPRTVTNAFVPVTKRRSTSAYSARNRSAAVRIRPTAKAEGQAPRISPADPAANPYLAFAALLHGRSGRHPEQNQAGRNRFDKKHLRTAARRTEESSERAGSLSEALDCLQKDHAFLTKGDVFTEDFIDDVDQHQAEGTLTPSACVRIRTNSSCITTCNTRLEERGQRRGPKTRAAFVSTRSAARHPVGLALLRRPKLPQELAQRCSCVLIPEHDSASIAALAR